MIARAPRRLVVAAVALALSALPATARELPAGASPVPGAPACNPVLPADNVWNTDISALPVHPGSGAWIQSMGGPARHLHPDFGPSGTSTPYGIPYEVVAGSHQKVNVTFQYAGESDPGPYPFGPETPIESGSDRHALMLDKDTCTLYELFDAVYNGNSSTAGSGAVFDLRSNALRPDTFTSADAAGLPILPGLVRLDEVNSGAVNHAIRVTASSTDARHIWPARHDAGSAGNSGLPPMGARFRLLAGIDISRYMPQTQVLLRAMQRYGMIVADNGSDWFFSGAADSGWDPAVLHELESIPAGDLEAVDESSLMISADTGQARQTPIRYDQGYWLATSDGGIFPFGRAAGYGSAGGAPLNLPVVGLAATADHGGYWLVAGDGGIFPFGDAGGYGSTGGLHLNSPIVGMAPAPGGRGYWLVASDGGVFPFGDAGGYGSTGGTHLNSPIVGMAPTPGGRGYWLVAGDGGIFPFGDAGGHGSTGGIHLNSPIAGMAPTPSGHGYWLVAADGGVFPFGDAGGHGSTGGIRLNSPIVAMVPSPSGQGYLLCARDGGVFPFGDAEGLGSTGGRTLNAPIVGIASA